tara:strand:- start:513 stop:809 length:297 start_codon:yes stop_codon:yes gene_type:complete
MKKLFILFIFLFNCTTCSQTSKKYYNIGLIKHQKGDYYGAITNYTKSIEINPNFAYAYFNRGIAKEILEDLNGACADYKIAARMGHIYAQEIFSDYCN